MEGKTMLEPALRARRHHLTTSFTFAFVPDLRSLAKEDPTSLAFEWLQLTLQTGIPAEWPAWPCTEHERKSNRKPSHQAHA